MVKNDREEKKKVYRSMKEFEMEIFSKSYAERLEPKFPTQKLKPAA